VWAYNNAYHEPKLLGSKVKHNSDKVIQDVLIEFE